MWYKNIAGRFFGLVTKHACDRQTDRITTPKTTLAQMRRAVKNKLWSLSRLLVNCINFHIQKNKTYDHTKTNLAIQYVKLVLDATASKQLGASKAICLQIVTDRAAKTE